MGRRIAMAIVLALSIWAAMMHVAAAQSNSQFYKNLLRAREVRQELKVTDEQHKEFNETEFERKRLMEAEFEELRQMEKEFPRDFAKRDEFLSKLHEAHRAATLRATKVEEKELAKIFDGKQIKRLEELRLQLLDLHALLIDPDVREQVGFSTAEAGEFQNKIDEFRRELAAEIKAEKQRAVEEGIPLRQVNRLWLAMERSEREVDYVLDTLTEEQEETFERGLRKSFNLIQQRRVDLEDELLESLPEDAMKKLKRMRGERFEFPPQFSRYRALQ